MPRPLPATTFGILGMLIDQPMSGYEIARAVDGSIANFWSISKSQVYGELVRLTELGFATATDVAQERRPDKRTYTATAEGRRAFDAWLARPEAADARLRSELLLKTFFAGRLPREAVVELLTTHRERALAERDRLDEIIDGLDHPDFYFMQATARYGRAVAEASARWADDVLAHMPAHTPERRRS